MIMVIATDFDGTLCESMWPGIGVPNTELIEALKNRRAGGDKVILWTCRDGDKLQEAIAWCKDQGLEFDAVNDNLQERKERWGNNPRKIAADIYIDDKASRVEYKSNRSMRWQLIQVAMEVLRDELLTYGVLRHAFIASIRSAIDDMPEGLPKEVLPELIMRRIIGED